MVNKGTFFQRLKDRWGSGSGVRVESSSSTSSDASAAGASAAKAADQRSGAPGPRDAAASPASRVEEPRAVSSTFQPADARSTRKMSEREEAMLAFGQHFQELTQLMRGAQAASDEKLQKIVEATTSMPALGQQQLDVLNALSAQVDKQNELGVKVSETMMRLPSLLENVEKALDRAAKTDERTAATVREFQSTMDRIHASMGEMVSTSQAQADAAKEMSERRSQEMEELKRANEESLQSLRRTHEDQSNRLQRVVEEHASWNKAVLVGVGLLVLGVGAVIVLQLVK